MIVQRPPYTGQPSPAMGFTLVEILVVVVIIAVLVAVTTLSLGVVEQREFRNQVDRLQLALQQAADSALFQQQTHGLHLDAQSGLYWVSDHQKGEWQQGDQSLFQPTQLDAKTTLSLIQPVPLDVRSGEEDPKKRPPVIVFSSGGEYTPFQIRLEQTERTAWLLRGDGLGKIRLELTND